MEISADKLSSLSQDAIELCRAVANQPCTEEFRKHWVVSATLIFMKLEDLYYEASSCCPAACPAGNALD
jgi:hypothetical protein